jgi:hypothetical protein
MFAWRVGRKEAVGRGVCGCCGVRFCGTVMKRTLVWRDKSVGARARGPIWRWRLRTASVVTARHVAAAGREAQQFVSRCAVGISGGIHIFGARRFCAVFALCPFTCRRPAAPQPWPRRLGGDDACAARPVTFPESVPQWQRQIFVGREFALAGGCLFPATIAWWREFAWGGAAARVVPRCLGSVNAQSSRGRTAGARYSTVQYAAAVRGRPFETWRLSAGLGDASLNGHQSAGSLCASGPGPEIAPLNV